MRKIKVRRVKKAQITAFLVIGILIIFGALLLFLAKRTQVETITDPTITVTQGPQLFPVNKYVSYCLEKELTNLTKTLAYNGGTLNISNKKTIYVNQHPVLLAYSIQQGNHVLSKESIEDELEKALIIKLDSCIDVKEYERLGYKVTEGEKTAQITIGTQEISTILNYHINVEKGETISFQNKFQENIEIPLGSFIDDANDIINSKLQGDFDENFYRIQNPELKLETTRPYPHIGYTIKSKTPKELSGYLEFSFGIEQLDMTSLKFSSPELFYTKDYNDNEGVCIINKDCFSYTKEAICLQKEGEFLQGVEESVCATRNRILTKQTIEELSLQNKIASYLDFENKFEHSCNGWYDAYTGNFIEEFHFNGESWCAYEPGTGGRYYKLSCNDGKVVVDQCSDFKDEICAQETLLLNISKSKNSNKESISFSTALCRPNRFWSCNSCDNEECCSNSENRDCVWEETLGCFPVSEPGLKFWNTDESTQICSQALHINSAGSTGQFNLNAKNCFTYGDCGAKENFAGIFSEGYSNANEHEELFEDIEHYQKAAQKSSLRLVNDYFKQFLPEKIIYSQFQTSFGFIEILNGYLKSVDEAMVYSINDYLNPAFDLDVDSIGIQACSPWAPLTINKCNLCNTNANPIDGQSDYSECSEYKCKSLGESCVFERVKGVPYCYSPNEDDIPLEITAITPQDYDFSTEETLVGNGVSLDEAVELFNPLNIRIETNKNALCKVSYLPNKNFEDIGSADLSNMQFTNAHDVSFTFNHEYDVFDRILTYFDEKSYTGLLSTLVDLRYKMEAVKRRYPTINKFQFGIYPLLVPLADYYLDSATQEKLQMIFNNIDSGNYFLFFKCLDQTGKESTDYYVRFNLNDPCSDITPPKIVETIPTKGGITDGTLKVYVNEISQCKYDSLDVNYDEMRYDFNCEQNPYLVKGVGNGSYLCETSFNKSADFFLEQNSAKIYIRCKDHPEFETVGESFTFKIQKSNGFENINNLTFNYENSPFNVVAYNSSSTAFIDLTQLVEQRDFGEFSVAVPEADLNYIEMLFEKSFECSTNAKIRCSSSRCVLENERGVDEQIVSCKQTIPECNAYENNVNEESYVLNVNKRNPLDIDSNAYVNNTFYLTISDSKNAQTNCGIELSSAQGFISMGRLSEDTFFFKQYSTQFGAHVARFLCLNKYGDIARSNLVYEIDE